MKYVQEKQARLGESRLVPRVALSASMGFAAYWTYLYFSQTKHIFSPALKHHDVLTHHAHEFTELRLQVAPGVELEGWVRMPAGMGGAGSKAPCAVYFGGRSEDVRWLLNEAQGFKNLPLVFFNYRGYGNSQGTPMEKNLVADARVIYKWVAEQPWCDRNQISVIGRSLGTGVAMQLAASTPVHKLVLFTPYDSLISIAKKKVPLAPVSLLLRSKFKSNECAANVRNPTFVLLAENDEVVPHDSSLRLMQHFAVKPLVATVKGTDHVSLPHDIDAQGLVSHFLTT
ncbi:alpha/beta hydrolase [Limnobacter sp.]|jgi:alpha/beta superfamily hydrolase|uniref:alpha/beta hydrolase n=1 Tax=Limnobacter sp. TaxID=2003368 RepID=UPI003BA86CCD